ncbi:MAG: zinc-dependent peptidase [Spirochaetales bacterium]|nr:zinc-dependent peptidase [Spirochaetales bacterium]
MGLFSFFKSRRRRKILERGLFDDGAWEWALEQHPILARLAEDEIRRLKGLAEIFAAEKEFVPERGIVIEPDMILSISVQAVLPVLALGLEWLDDFRTIFVAPRSVRRERKRRFGPAIEEYTETVAGEVDYLGPITLSWRDVEASGWGDGFNVVIHEIAHKLDLSNRAMDGCPFLGDDLDPARWKRVFSAAYGETVRRLESGLGTYINSYAAESPAEFFAVACEEFFERPAVLRRHFPEVYGELKAFLKQDPLRKGTTDDTDRNGLHE